MLVVAELPLHRCESGQLHVPVPQNLYLLGKLPDLGERDGPLQLSQFQITHSEQNARLFIGGLKLLVQTFVQLLNHLVMIKPVLFDGAIVVRQLFLHLLHPLDRVHRQSQLLLHGVRIFELLSCSRHLPLDGLDRQILRILQLGELLSILLDFSQQFA